MKPLGIIFGSFVALQALPFLIVGAVLFGLVGDGSRLELPLDGFTVPRKAVAIVSPEFSLKTADLPSVLLESSVTLRFTSKPGDKPLFIGLAPSRDVKRYLRNAPIAHVESKATKPTTTSSGSSASTSEGQSVGPGEIASNGTTVELTLENGSRKSVPPPAAQDFWIRQVHADQGDEITLTLADLAGKNSRVVVMRADGKPGIRADAAFRLRIPILSTIGLWTFLIGLIGFVLGALLSVILAFYPERRPMMATVTPTDPPATPGS